MTDLTALAAAKYMSVTTYKRDGTPVATPVWVVADPPGVSFYSVADQGKIKRIRNNPKVTVAPCTISGKLLGTPVPGSAEILPPDEARRVRALIRKRNGLFGWLTVRDRDTGPRASVAVRVTLV